MATYDDYNGVYFTIQALRLYHPICKTNEVEFIILDSNPEGAHGKELKNFQGWVPNLKYIESKKASSFNKYDIPMYHAEGKYTLLLDCHVLLLPNSLDALLDYYADNRNCKDIVQGPMFYDDLKNYSTHYAPRWGSDAWGKWATNTESFERKVPFEIMMLGLGAWSCETKNFPKISKYFRGFGGEEGYIHEKFRRNGGKAICIPDFQWLHRFGRPDGVSYTLTVEDRLWNYFIGWLDVTKDPQHPMILDIKDNFKDRVPEETMDKIFLETQQLILNEEYSHANS